MLELVQAWLSSLSGLMYVTFFDLDSDYFLISFFSFLVTEFCVAEGREYKG